MKKILLFLIAAISFAACNGNGDKKTEGANLELDSITDSIRVKVGESTLNVDAKITYPTNAESIKKDLMELVKQIGQGDDFDGYPDSLKIDTTDMRSLVNYVVKSKAEWLKADFGEDVEPVTPMSYSLEVNVLEETDKYITMGVYEELMFSGPHPNYTSYGITYLKPDGKKVKLGDLDDSGRRKPVGTGVYETINADYIISAIGQTPDESVWNAKVIETDHGYIKGIKNYGEAFETSVHNIFTGGDIIKGAKTIGVATKCGKDFAKYVIEQLEKK